MDLGGQPKSRLEALKRRAVVLWLQSRRLATRLTQEHAAPLSRQSGMPHRIWESAIPIRRNDSAAHPTLEAGKLINLKLAAPHFDGLVLTPQHPLSFWRALGRISEARGFRAGMEVQAGCIVPALGGGLCLLSNALFELAAHLGWRILERHGHTREATPPRPGTLWGLDATVFWPYVDLCIAPATGRARLTVRVEDEVLHLAVDASEPLAYRVELESVEEQLVQQTPQRIRINRIRRRLLCPTTGRLLSRAVIADNRKALLHAEEQRRSCLTCGETSCHVREGALQIARA